MLPIFNQ
jgi:serine/threonine protein kinase